VAGGRAMRIRELGFAQLGCLYSGIGITGIMNIWQSQQR
jgi:hypothetical protein